MSERQTFQWLRWIWDVDLALAKFGDRDPGVLNVAGAAGLLGMGVVTVDAAHVPEVDLSKPLLVVPLPNADGLLVIDGWHRIAKALQQGTTQLPAIFLTKPESMDVMIEADRPARRARR